MGDPLQSVVVPLTVITSIISSSLTIYGIANSNDVYRLGNGSIIVTGQHVRSVLYSDAWVSLAMVTLTLAIIAGIVLYYQQNKGKRSDKSRVAVWFWTLGLLTTVLNSVMVAVFLSQFDSLDIGQDTPGFRGTYPIGMMAVSATAIFFCVGAFLLSDFSGSIKLKL